MVAAGRQPRPTRVLDPVLDAPAGWRATRDRDTGVIAQLWGGFVDAPGAMRDPAIAERAARDFLATHLNLLAPGARLTDFVLVANRLDGALRTVAFGQRWNGLRVVGGQLHVVFARDRLFVASSDALPQPPADLPDLRRSPKPATGRAQAWLRAATQTAVTTRATGERVLLPLVHGPGDLEYHVADVLDARTRDGHWDVYVAPDGAPLLRVNRLSFAAGTLRFDVPERRPTGARKLAPAARTNITVDAIAATTADDGAFSWAGNAPSTVDTSVIGTIVQLVNVAGALATAQLVAPPDLPVDWSLAADEFGDAQLTAYVYGMIAKARARTMHPALAWLDQPLQIHVNEDDSCNAFSTGDDLHFFRKNATCENTGRLADVVLHEFAHSFHRQTIIPGVGQFNSGMSEGIADFYAANIVEDPGVGRGFHFDDQAVRDLDPPGAERVFPADVNGIPHLTGLIIGGALWDLRKALVAELGMAEGRAVTEQIFVGVLQRASDLPTTYLAALTTDDDDGNLGNGTPHGCAIEAAFGRHGLAGPAFATTKLEPPVVSGRDVSVTVTTPNTPCPRPQVTTMTLEWQHAGGAPAMIAMTPRGASWTATLPPQPDGTVVRYQVTAALDDGSTVRFPDNPADPLYELFVGEATPIWCERLDRDPVWTQTGTLEWEWTTPFGRSGDPPAPFTGVAILGTDVRGDGRYLPDDRTSIETPAIDVSGYERVHLQFRRWLTVEDSTRDHATIAIDGVTIWENTPTPSLDHVDKEWRFVDFEITPSTGVKIVWALTSDGSGELGGWNLDDICLVGLGKLARCGDAVVDVDEACDDGNDVPGDGCTPECVDELADDGGCCSSGSNPAGGIALGFAAFALLRRRDRRHLRNS